MTSCLLTQFGHLCPSFLSVCARVRVGGNTCHLMTPSHRATSATVRFLSSKRAARHKSGFLFKREVTQCKAAQTHLIGDGDRLAFCHRQLIVSRLSSEVV